MQAINVTNVTEAVVARSVAVELSRVDRLLQMTHHPMCLHGTDTSLRQGESWDTAQKLVC